MNVVDNGSSRCGARTAWLRADHAAGRVVGHAAGDVPRALGLRRVRHLGRVPERALHLRSLPVAVLLARAIRRLAARLVRREAGRRAAVAAVLARAADPALSGPLPSHLLLLPWRVLQGVLGRSALVRGR